MCTFSLHYLGSNKDTEYVSLTDGASHNTLHWGGGEDDNKILMKNCSESSSEDQGLEKTLSYFSFVVREGEFRTLTFLPRSYE